MRLFLGEAERDEREPEGDLFFLLFLSGDGERESLRDRRRGEGDCDDDRDDDRDEEEEYRLLFAFLIERPRLSIASSSSWVSKSVNSCRLRIMSCMRSTNCAS